MTKKSVYGTVRVLLLECCWSVQFLKKKIFHKVV